MSWCVRRQDDFVLLEKGRWKKESAFVAGAWGVSYYLFGFDVKRTVVGDRCKTEYDLELCNFGEWRSEGWVNRYSETNGMV